MCQEIKNKWKECGHMGWGGVRWCGQFPTCGGPKPQHEPNQIHDGLCSDCHARACDPKGPGKDGEPSHSDFPASWSIWEKSLNCESMGTFFSSGASDEASAPRKSERSIPDEECVGLSKTLIRTTSISHSSNGGMRNGKNGSGIRKSGRGKKSKPIAATRNTRLSPSFIKSSISPALDRNLTNSGNASMSTQGPTLYTYTQDTSASSTSPPALTPNSSSYSSGISVLDSTENSLNSKMGYSSQHVSLRSREEICAINTDMIHVSSQPDIGKDFGSDMTFEPIASGEDTKVPWLGNNPYSGVGYIKNWGPSQQMVPVSYGQETVGPETMWFNATKDRHSGCLYAPGITSTENLESELGNVYTAEGKIAMNKNPQLDQYQQQQDSYPQQYYYQNEKEQ